MTTDATHRPERQSWVESANDHPDFPLQNLPLGVFSLGSGARRGGVAIGESVLDLAALVERGLLDGPALAAAKAASGESLNAFFALGADARRALRAGLGALLDADAPARPQAEQSRAAILHAAADCTMHRPASIGDYTDFFAGIHHASNTGRMFRPDNPLVPNYKYVPIGYHGRVSSIGVSGMPVRRPNGQRKPANEAAPTFGPSRNLDYELEFGIWVGRGNEQGEAVPIAEAGDHIAGFCLLNDWSARDVQGWEYQPLGPFLAKSFATTISPWVVTPEALAPFRIPQPARPEGDPAPLAYLFDEADQARGALDIELEVLLETDVMREKGAAPQRLSIGNTKHLYWTVAQLLAHHACGGCNLQPGDLFGSGTISSATRDGFGSFLEISEGGRNPFTLASGETRRFLEDGDTVIMRARARRDGYAMIGFGECRGTILPSKGTE